MPRQRHAFNIWRSFLFENKFIYLVGVFTVLVTAIFQVVATRIIGWIIDFFGKKEIPSVFVGQDNYETFIWLFLTLLGARVLLTFGRMGWRLTLARQTHKASRMMRGRIWDNVRLFKKKDLATKYTKGALLNASNSDVNSSRFIFGFTLVAAIDVIFLGFFTLVAMFMIHIPMTLLSLLVLLVLPLFIRKLSDAEIIRYEKAQESLSQFDDLSAQVVSTIRLQRLTQTGSFWERRLLKEADDYRKKRLSAVFTSLKYIPTMGGAAIISYLLLFLMGIKFVLSGQMSAGDFVSMQGLIFLLQDPLMELGFIISDWKKGMTSLGRLSEIYELKKEESLLIKGNKLKENKEILKIENVSFAYDEEQDPILNELNLTLNQGDRLGISGPIGTGKTTLVNILAGLERGHGGEIYFLGEKFNNYGHRDLRKYIGIVHQKPFLFADSIRNNIAVDRHLSDKEVWHYLEIAGLKDDVDHFPDKLETQLGEWGINLSGGQKQRLTLARAISRRPQLLFLDDCLSAVDTVTEEKILRSLDQELKETTLVWVAHRKSTLKYCSQFLELQ